MRGLNKRSIIEDSLITLRNLRRLRKIETQQDHQLETLLIKILAI